MLYSDTLRYKFCWLIILKRMIIPKAMQNSQCEIMIKLHFTKIQYKRVKIPFTSSVRSFQKGLIIFRVKHLQIKAVEYSQ